MTGTPDLPVEHDFEYANTFVREDLSDGTKRLKIGLRSGQATALHLLGSALRAPYRILYILHTSLADAELGRYESPDLDGRDIEAFSRSFGTFIAQDARHDVWLQSMPDGGPIVIDRYNMVYAYGPIDRISDILKIGGIAEVASWAAPTVPYPHALHYHRELNALEAELLAAFPWIRKPLHDTDVQFWSGPEAV